MFIWLVNSSHYITLKYKKWALSCPLFGVQINISGFFHKLGVVDDVRTYMLKFKTYEVN